MNAFVAKHKKAIVIGGSVIAGLTVGGVGYYFYKKHRDAKNAEKPKESPKAKAKKTKATAKRKAGRPKKTQPAAEAKAA